MTHVQPRPSTLGASTGRGRTRILRAEFVFLAGLASQGFAEALRGEHDEPPAMLSSDPSTPTTTKGTSLMIMIPTSNNEDTRTSWRWIGLHGVDDR
jgi:hypothetical protein